MDDRNFVFSLYPGDLIRVKSNRPIKLKLKNRDASGDAEKVSKEWLLYFVSADISTGSIEVTSHDRKYWKKGFGIKTLLAMEKYEVDVLGKYHQVHLPEKRQTFR